MRPSAKVSRYIVLPCFSASLLVNAGLLFHHYRCDLPSTRFENEGEMSNSKSASHIYQPPESTQPEGKVGNGAVDKPILDPRDDDATVDAVTLFSLARGIPVLTGGYLNPRLSKLLKLNANQASSVAANFLNYSKSIEEAKSVSVISLSDDRKEGAFVVKISREVVISSLEMLRENITNSVDGSRAKLLFGHSDGVSP